MEAIRHAEAAAERTRPTSPPLAAGRRPSPSSGTSAVGGGLCRPPTPARGRRGRSFAAPLSDAADQSVHGSGQRQAGAGRHLDPPDPVARRMPLVLREARPPPREHRDVVTPADQRGRDPIGARVELGRCRAGRGRRVAETGRSCSVTTPRRLRHAPRRARRRSATRRARGGVADSVSQFQVSWAAARQRRRSAVR